jgi:hypothetical protein
MKSFLRVSLSIVLGNALGYGLFRLAGWATPQLWRDGPPSSFGTLVFRMMVVAISFGTPPVFVGAVMARLAGRYEPWVGLGSALWGLSARFWWPQTVPFLPPQSWVAPTMLILMSGLIGGWLIGNRPPLTPVVPLSASPTSIESSKDSVS